MTTLTMPTARKTDSLTLARKDVFLIADVETRQRGKFNLTVHAVPKSDKATAMVEKLKYDPNAFRWGDYNTAVRSYWDMQNGMPTLRAARENWHYAGWENGQGAADSGWLLLGSTFSNDQKALGALGLPVSVTHTYASTGEEIKDRVHIKDPNRFGISPTTRVDYALLDKKSYAVRDLTAQLASNGYVYWMAFHNKNHHDLNVSKIVWGESDPGHRLERVRPGAKQHELAEVLSGEEAAPLWEKLRQYDRTTAELCAALGVPDLSLACTGKPRIISDINALGLDGVTGNECPALAPTYKRLGVLALN